MSDFNSIQLTDVKKPLARTSSPCLVDKAKMFATQHTDGTSARAESYKTLYFVSRKDAKAQSFYILLIVD